MLLQLSLLLPFPPQSLCSLSYWSQVWPNMCPCSVSSCQNWPVVPACLVWGLLSPNSLIQHISYSSQLPVLHKSDPHAVNGLGQAIDKNDQEGEGRKQSPEVHLRRPYQVRLTQKRELPKVVIPQSSHLFPKVLMSTASMSHRHTMPGESPHPPKSGRGTKAGPSDLFSGNSQWVLVLIRAYKSSF